MPIAWVQAALDRLESDGEIEISVPSVGYRSAFIGAVLREVPGAEVVRTASPPRVRLTTVRERLWVEGRCQRDLVGVREAQGWP